MAFERPTLAKIHERITADIDANTNGQPRLRRSPFGVFATVMSGAMHELYGFQQYRAAQILPDSADEQHFERHASIHGTSQNPDSYAIGFVLATGVDGFVVEQGKKLQRADGVEYKTTEEKTIAAGQAIIAIIALNPGDDGNANAGAVLNFIETIAGVDNTATVTEDALTNGADIEQLEPWRQRHLDVIQTPPHSGAKHDFIDWAKEVPGVTRAWCYPLENGDGTVTVRFVRDNDENLIPEQTEIEVVYEYIKERMHVTGWLGLSVLAPTPVPLDLTIELHPDTTAIRSAVEAEIEDLLSRTQPEDGQGKGTIYISKLREAVSIAAGEDNHRITSHNDDISYQLGEMAVKGTFTWL